MYLSIDDKRHEHGRPKNTCYSLLINLIKNVFSNEISVFLYWINDSSIKPFNIFIQRIFFIIVLFCLWRKYSNRLLFMIGIFLKRILLKSLQSNQNIIHFLYIFRNL